MLLACCWIDSIGSLGLLAGSYDDSSLRLGHIPSQTLLSLVSRSIPFHQRQLTARIAAAAAAPLLYLLLSHKAHVVSAAANAIAGALHITHSITSTVLVD